MRTDFGHRFQAPKQKKLCLEIFNMWDIKKGKAIPITGRGDE
jgi:hypothetical protein